MVPSFHCRDSGICWVYLQHVAAIEDAERTVNVAMQDGRSTWEYTTTQLPGYQNAEIHYIPLNRLRYPYQSEEATNEDKVMDNVRRMKAGEPLSPVVVGLDHDTLDGHHKIKAAERMGYTHAPCCVGHTDDFSKAVANARYRSMWNGMTKSLPLLHGTNPKSAENIARTGFRPGTDGHDFGVAVYFKSPKLDPIEHNEITSADAVVRRYENGAAIRAKLANANVLDLSKPENWPHKNLLDALSRFNTGGTSTSPYEAYARQNGFDAIIGEIPSKPDEGWVIGVFDPSKIKVTAVGKPAEDVLQKSLGDAKKLHGDLTGGHWVTINHNHVYIKGGKIVAGGIPGFLSTGDSITRKMNKKEIAEHQKYYDAKQAKAGQPQAQKPGTGQKQYHMYTSDGYKPVNGSAVNVHKDLNAFHHKADGRHYVNEASTGMVLGQGDSKKAAVDNAKANINQHGVDRVKATIDAHHTKNGVSPSHAQNNGGGAQDEKPAKPKAASKGAKGGKPKPASGNVRGSGGGPNAGGTEGAGQDTAGDRPDRKGLPVKPSSVVKEFPEHGMYEVSDPKEFHAAISAAKAGNDHGAFVHAYEPDEYAEKKMFLNADKSAGVAVTKDGDIVSVFKHPDCKQKGVSAHMMMVALKNGGKKLDCFDGFLPSLYSKFGFEPVAKLPFNKEYAPEGWNYERDGEPHVVFMKHNGDTPEQIMAKGASGGYPKPDMSKVPEVDDYDKGAALQNGQAPAAPAPSMDGPPAPLKINDKYSDPEPAPSAEKAPEPAPAPSDKTPEPVKAQVRPAKDRRASRTKPEFMRQKPEIPDEVKAKANTPYVPGGKIPAALKPHIDAAFKAARANPTNPREYYKALSPDAQRAMGRAKIDPGEFHINNHSEEATVRNHAKEHVPTVKNDAAKRAENAMHKQMGEDYGGKEGEYYLYHGTSVAKASHILKHGFGMNGGQNDFGNAAYFKTPAMDQHDVGNAGVGVAKSAMSGDIVNAFAQQAGDNPAVMKVKVTGGKILDCKKDGRPPELDNLLKGWHAKPQGNDEAAKQDIAKRRAILHYEGKVDAKDTAGKSKEELDSLMDQHYGTENDEERGNVLHGTSPYELYAKKHGYDMVVDKLDQFKGEGWQIGVYNPKILQVVDIGKSLQGTGAGAKLQKSLNGDSAETKKSKGKAAPYTLLNFTYEDGVPHLHVGCQDDRGSGPSKPTGEPLVKAIPMTLIKAIYSPDPLIKGLSHTKKLYPDLPPGGEWKTIMHHHVYIKDGKILAGGLPLKTKVGSRKLKDSEIKAVQEKHDADEKLRKFKETGELERPTLPKSYKPESHEHKAWTVGGQTVHYTPKKIGGKHYAFKGGVEAEHAVAAHPDLKELRRMVGKIAGREQSRKDAVVIEDASAEGSNILPHGKIYHDGMSAEAATEFNKTLESIRKRWPQVLETLKHIGSFSGLRSNNLLPTGLTSATGAFMESEKAIGINQAKFKSHNQVIGDVQSAGSGWLSAGASLESVINHEFGHAVHFYFKVRHFKTYRKLRELATTWMNDAPSKPKDRESYYAKSLSIYASSNVQEFVAEAFAEYATSKNPRPIAKQVGQILEEGFVAVKSRKVGDTRAV